MKKTVFTLVLFMCMLPKNCYAELNIASEAAILVNEDTGTVIYEKNADEQLPMASVTKTMTLLLVSEAIENNTISLDDLVIVSENASSMTGSRVYLSTNEKISVSDLIKSIAVSSGNDAAVAMAEYIAGSEEKFVKMMNAKAASLNLSNTNFVNCYGLDADNHYSTARDLYVISSELLKYDFIKPYLTIWMDSIRNGTFTLANTNKLVKFYDGCTGIKTGFTSKAMYCLSASAERDDTEYISVVLGGPNSKARFKDASDLLNYGFDNYVLKSMLVSGDSVGTVKVNKGKVNYVNAVVSEDIKVLLPKGDDEKITKKVNLKNSVSAPVSKGDILGSVLYYIDDELIKSADIVANVDVKKKNVFDIYSDMIIAWTKL